jgi:hypothetical protein
VGMEAEGEAEETVVAETSFVVLATGERDCSAAGYRAKVSSLSSAAQSTEERME